MTAGTTEPPSKGHILRYVYLFKEEQDGGRDEGIKERFVAVVGQEGTQYRVAAITTKGEGNAKAIALPAEVARAAGVSSNSWVVVSEFNRFEWPGFDIRPLMDKPGFIAGRLPPSFTAKIIGLIESQAAAPVDRD